MRRSRWSGLWLAALPATNLFAPVTDRLPVGFLTLALAALLPVVALELLRRPAPSSLLVPLGIGGLLVPATLWTPADGTVHVLTALLLTMVPMALPAILIRTREAIQWYLYGAIAVGLAVALIAPTGGQGRLLPEAGNVIELGRVSALAALVAAGLAVLTTNPKLLLAGLPCGYVALAAGSRGPFVAVVAASCYLILDIRFATRRRRWGARAVTISVLAAVMTSAWSAAPDASVDRFRLTHDHNSEIRSQMYREGVDLLLRYPFGIGWGQYGESVLWLPGDAYIHNMFLEVWIEGGLLAGVGLLAITSTLAAILWRSRDPLGRLIGASLVFWAVAASFSGSFFFNRALFLSIGVALATYQVLHRDQLIQQRKSQLPVGSLSTGSHRPIR